MKATRGLYVGGFAAIMVAACSVPRERSTRGPDAANVEPPSPAFRPLLVLPLPAVRANVLQGTKLAAFSGRDTPIQDVLLALFKDSNLNLMVDPSVTGNATFDIKGTTVEHAFEALMQTLDLAYTWDGEFLRIGTLERCTLDVDMLQGSTEARAASGAAAAGVVGAGGATGSEPWQLLTEDLTRILGQRGSVVVNSFAGTVHVEGPPGLVVQARRHLQHLTRRMEHQVSIEARILEVRLKDEFRLGVNWSLLPGFLNTTKTGTLPGGAIFAQTAASAATAFNFGVLKAGDFSIFIDALEAQGQVRVLSSPRVAAMNNQPATFRVVDQIPVIEREVIDSLGGVRTQFNIRFVDAGVSVEVTPQVSQDGVITVNVHPTVTEQTGSVTTPDNLQVEPILSTRETTTVLRVPDGQAVVIGGLRSSRKNENLEGIPVLSSIPVLGALFRSTIQQREDVELIVLVAPRRLDQTWLTEERRRGLDRLLRLERPFELGTIHLNDPDIADWGRGSSSGRPIVPGPKEPTLRLETAPAVRIPPTVSVSAEGLADRLIARAAAHLVQGDPGSAGTLLEQSLTLDPARADARGLAAVLAAHRGDLARTIDLVEPLLAAEPADPFALTARGAVEWKRGAVAAAARWFEQAHQARPGSLSANNLAATWIASGDLARARTLLETWAKEERTLFELHTNLAHVQQELGDLDAARASLQTALTLGADPEDPRVLALRRRLARD